LCSAQSHALSHAVASMPFVLQDNLGELRATATMTMPEE